MQRWQRWRAHLKHCKSKPGWGTQELWLWKQVRKRGRPLARQAGCVVLGYLYLSTLEGTYSNCYGWTRHNVDSPWNMPYLEGILASFSTTPEATGIGKQIHDRSAIQCRAAEPPQHI